MPTTRVLATLACAFVATGAAAQTPRPSAGAKPPPEASFTLPRAYAGYSQPEITGCVTSGPAKRACTVPAMTAGRYLIVAAGSATATGAKPTQSISIQLNGEPCETIKPVAFTGKKALRGACLVNFLTDQAVTVAADYTVTDATADAAAPQLVLRRLPWTGIVEARPMVLAPPNPAAATQKP